MGKLPTGEPQMVKTYSFVEQFERGLEGEKVLDKYFSQWYIIKDATLDQQKNEKIDRLFRPKGAPSDTPWIKVEYKTDDKTDKTGNLFIETMSMIEWGKYGWAWITHAQKVIYYALPDTVYILDTAELRDKLMLWHKQRKPKRKVYNDHWTSEGYLIKTDEIVDWIGEKNVRIIP
jgi:hypothetical protein